MSTQSHEAHSELSGLEHAELARRHPRKAFVAFAQPIDTPRGRYDGKPNTWLSESEEPRGIATSLQQTESNDLSIHLYNTQRVKRRACNDEVEERRVKPYFRKDHRTAQGGQNSWIPSTKWTAWPLQPDVVPRGGEKEERWLQEPNDCRTATESRLSPQKPTAHLEDCLLSEILSQSRSSFYGHREVDGINRETHLYTPRSGTLPSEIMTDEERARQLSKPVIRDIVSQMESLLEALHASRRGHARDQTFDSGTDASSGLESSDPRTRSRSRQRKLHSGERKAPLPRDWTEVLSIAGMVGWDSRVLQQTATRCSSLFDEPLDRVMTFDATATNSTSLKLTPDAQDGEGDDSDDSDAPSEASRELSMRTLCCPYRKCRRHSKPFKIRWRLNEHLRRTHKEGNTSRSISRSLGAEYGRASISKYADDFLKPTVLHRGSKTHKAQSKRNKQSLQRPEPSDDASGQASDSASDATTTDTLDPEPSDSSEPDESDSSDSEEDQEDIESRSTGSSDVGLSDSDQSSGGSTITDEKISSQVSGST